MGEGFRASMIWPSARQTPSGSEPHRSLARDRRRCEARSVRELPPAEHDATTGVQRCAGGSDGIATTGTVSIQLPESSATVDPQLPRVRADACRPVTFACLSNSPVRGKLNQSPMLHLS